MRTLAKLLFLAAVTAVTLSPSSAQPPAGKEKKGGSPAAGGAEGLIARMMAFDKNKDGKLTRDEITDERLQRLFDRADANKDGIVTKEELQALAAQEAAIGGGPGGRGGFGPPGEGGKGGRGEGGRGGRGGPGGPGGFGGPLRPGLLLPPFLQDELKLTDDQKKQVEALQKDVDEKLAKILTDDQKKQLQEMRDRGPGGPGGRGGRGGFGGPGGPGGERRP